MLVAVGDLYRLRLRAVGDSNTVPYADGGPTQAGNLKCVCRCHHLLKTFGGWKEEQLPDGAVI